MRRSHYGVVVVNYYDIDDKPRKEYFACFHKNEWIRTQGEAYDKYRRLLADGEILEFEVKATLTKERR